MMGVDQTGNILDVIERQDGQDRPERSCQPKRFASLIGSDSVAVWPSPTTRFDGSTARLK